MKHILSVILLSSLSLTAFSQEVVSDTSWKRGGEVGINFTQVSLSNWSAGGQSSLSGLAFLNYFANYKKGKNCWDNTINLAYGMTQNDNANPIKNEDKIDISTKFGRVLSGHWNYSALLGFKSQFTEGFDYPNDSVAISDFMAPAYITFALGFDYKPNDDFSMFISPASIRFIIVNDQNLADLGSFGVDPAEYDAAGVKLKNGEKNRYEAGALLKMTYKKDILENVNLSTKLELFSDYLENPQNIDVLWDVIISMKVNKFLSASISTSLIYDDNTKIAVDDNGDGITDRNGPRTQFKEVLAVGLNYKF